MDASITPWRTPMARPSRGGKRAFGETLELAAANFLTRQGLTLVCRNFHCKLGEIDLIVLDKNALVFVEVRYRRSSRYGSAAATVDRRKQTKLLRAAQFYLLRSGLRDRLPCRFDVLGIAPSPGSDELRYDWIIGAFTA